MTEEKKTATKNTDKKIDELVKLKGKYIECVGRRKTSVARVRIYKKGTGIIIVNGKNIKNNSSRDLTIIKQPLKVAGKLKEYDVSVVVNGGGLKGQAEAVRHGASRCLIKMDEELKPLLKAKGWLTRDARKKERKKPGLKKARRAPQWSKR